MSSILVIYGSGSGQTQKVAEFLGKELRSLGHEVDLVFGKRVARSLTPANYDAAIVAASVRMSRYQRYIEDFVRKHHESLNAMPSAFVSVSMAEAHPNAPQGGFQQEWLDAFISKTGWKPGQFASFGGALSYRSYNLITRFIMKKIAQQSGMSTDTSRNHEYTSWDAVRQFARGFSESIGQYR
jgi:menaquinone-dependent protoporphyrinogen oxidase